MLTFRSPHSPADMDWSLYYPAFVVPSGREGGVELPAEDSSGLPTRTMREIKPDVEIADIGCGFGGLLVALAPKLPSTLILGML